jgi:hypothetical protein
VKTLKSVGTLLRVATLRALTYGEDDAFNGIGDIGSLGAGGNGAPATARLGAVTSHSLGFAFAAPGELKIQGNLSRSGSRPA